MEKDPYIKLMDFIQNKLCDHDAVWIPMEAEDNSEELTPTGNYLLGESVDKAFHINQKIKGRDGLWFVVYNYEMRLRCDYFDSIQIELYITPIEPCFFTEDLRKGQVDFGLILGQVSWSTNQENEIELKEVRSLWRKAQTSQYNFRQTLKALSEVLSLDLTS